MEFNGFDYIRVMNIHWLSAICHINKALYLYVVDVQRRKMMMIMMMIMMRIAKYTLNECDVGKLMHHHIIWGTVDDLHLYHIINHNLSLICTQQFQYHRNIIIIIYIIIAYVTKTVITYHANAINIANIMCESIDMYVLLTSDIGK